MQYRPFSLVITFIVIFPHTDACDFFVGASLAYFYMYWSFCDDYSSAEFIGSLSWPREAVKRHIKSGAVKIVFELGIFDTHVNLSGDTLQNLCDFFSVHD